MGRLLEKWSVCFWNSSWLDRRLRRLNLVDLENRFVDHMFCGCSKWTSDNCHFVILASRYFDALKFIEKRDKKIHWDVSNSLIHSWTKRVFFENLKLNYWSFLCPDFIPCSHLLVSPPIITIINIWPEEKIRDFSKKCAGNFTFEGLP